MKKSEKVYLAIDLGASSGRVVVGVPEDRRLRTEQIARFSNAPCQLGNRLVWNFPSLWNDVLEAMRCAARQGYDHLAGIGVDTWGADFGLLGADGNLLANPSCYRDPLTEGIERVIASTVSENTLFTFSGVPLIARSTLAQLVALANSPGGPILRACDTLLNMPDLFRYFLSGHKAAELTTVGNSQLYDLKNARWHTGIARAFGLPRRILPSEIVKPGTIVGRLQQALAKQTALNRCSVIAVAGHDTSSATAAVPFADDETAFISCGTWSVVGVIQKEPIAPEKALPHGLINLLSVESLAPCLMMMGLHLFEGWRRQILDSGQKITYAQMVKEASKAKPFDCFVDPTWPTFFVTSDPEGSVREFLRKTRQKVPRHRGAMIRASLEGLAWTYRSAIGVLESLTGRKLKRICLVGGGVRNRLLCQVVADATGRTVIAGPAEATAIGNLGAQMIATGQAANVASVRQLVQDSFRLRKYKPQMTGSWDKRACRYSEVVARSKSSR